MTAADPLLELVWAECFECGVLIWMTDLNRAHRLGDKKALYCLNGHAQAFQGETDATKAARLERVNADLVQQVDNLAAERRLLLAKVKKLTPPRAPRKVKA